MHFRTGIREVALAAGSLSLAAGGLLFAAQSHATPEPLGGAPTSGVAINGVSVSRVNFDGKMMSLARWSRLSPRLNASGQRTYTYIAPSSIRLGYVQATTDVRQLIAWSGHDPRVTPPQMAATD